MNITIHRVELPLAHPFTISRGTLNSQGSAYVQLEHDGIVGLGEVTENSYYGHTFESVSNSIEKVKPYLEGYLTQTPQEYWPELAARIEGDFFALSAIDIAANDWKSKSLNIPLWQMWDLEWNDVVSSSYTIGIDTIDKMIEKMRELPDWPIYKIKLGTENDLELIESLRSATSARFRVDANCAWTADQTIDYSARLEELGVEFIEQPLPADAPGDEKRKVFENSKLPVIADEDCIVPADVKKCAEYYHGVNVKICKCGGLSPALGMLKEARQLNLKTMVGCMVESSIAISGAAHLLPLLDYADLDGATLLKAEPARGIEIKDGHVDRPDSPGTGASLLNDELPRFQNA